MDLVDIWREKNNFPQKSDYEFKEGRKLIESFKKWDRLNNSEEYDQSMNLLIEQYRNFPPRD